MKGLYFLLLFLYANAICAQSLDNFNDGDLTDNPAWVGETEKFQVNVDNQLQLNGLDETDEAYISTAVVLSDSITWSFYVMQDFNPSSSNHARVYLMSDVENLEGDVNGYYIKTGGQTSATDSIELFRQDGASSTKLMGGTMGAVGTDPNEFRIRITRDFDGNWTLETDYTGGTSYVVEATANDNTYLDGNYFGIACQYTSTRNDKFFFDDIEAGPVFNDITPPEITNLEIIDASSVRLTVSEPITEVTAINISNYFLIPLNQAPDQATWSASTPSEVQLTFSVNFVNGTSYQLNVQGIEDGAGNEMIQQELLFDYIIPMFGDILINEILADPSPIVGLPDAEFVELFNTTDSDIDLSNWTFSDASSSSTITSAIVPAQDFLIITSNSAVSLFEPFGTTVGVSSFPSLNNTGDNLSIKDQNGVLIDSVSYTDDWYRDDIKDDGGWSLERIDPNIPCQGAENWIASINALGGTPGSINSVTGVLTDMEAPQISTLSILGNDTLHIVFNESIDLATLIISNFSVDQGIGNPLELIILSETQIQLVLSQNLVFGTNYQLTINGIADCPGNVANNLIQNFGIPAQPELFDVLITEIFADPSPIVGLPEVEYLEIYNISSNPFDLLNWKINDASGSDDLPAYLLQPNEYLILCDDDDIDLFTSFGNVLGVPGFPSLNNSGDDLTLLDPDSMLIHLVSYTDHWYQSPVKMLGGWSLEMIDTSNPCEGAANWVASSDPNGGTPGQVNSVLETNPDETNPDLLNVLVRSTNEIELVFSEGLDLNLAENETLYTIDNGLGNPISASLNFPFLNRVVLALNTNLEPQTIYTVTVTSQLTDCVGNPVMLLNSLSFGISEIPAIGDIIINEIMPNPISGGSDYVELYNTSNKIIGLNDLLIAKYNEEGEIDDLEIITEESLQILPQSYVAMSEDIQHLIDHYQPPADKIRNLLNINDLPSMPDDTGSVVLISLIGEVIDSVQYSDDWHLPIIDDEDGISLERIRFDLPSNDATSWHSAASSFSFGTPGYRNSQAFDGVIQNGELTTSPEVFSPNNDAMDDVLSIHYEVPSPGYTATVTIFNSRGLEIKRLTQSEVLAPQGTFIWDGFDEDGQRARIGIYIIYFEAFNSSGDVIELKEKAVLADFWE